MTIPLEPACGLLAAKLFDCFRREEISEKLVHHVHDFSPGVSEFTSQCLHK